MNATDAPNTSCHATVVGAGGYIGSKLVAHLQRSGWSCTAVRRGETVWMQRPLGHVFYCAGLTADHALHPHDTVQAHVGLLNELLQHGHYDSLVYLSSTRLYDGLPGPVVDEDSALALNPANPRHVFDLSKALGEALCRHASQGRARVARLSCVVSDDPDAPGFLPNLMRQLRLHRGGPLEVNTSLHAARDYVAMEDVLQALVRIACRGTQAAYNVASGHNIGNAELLQRLNELSGHELHARHRLRVASPAVVSVERLRREFGWQPSSLWDTLPAWLAMPQVPQGMVTSP